MLACKTFEVRDAATFIPCVAVLCDPETWNLGVIVAEPTEADVYLLRRAGYGAPRLVIFTRLDGHPSNIAPYDPFEWGRNRTMTVAHEYVSGHWDELESGVVIDVEFILGESKKPKESERTERRGFGLGDAAWP